MYWENISEEIWKSLKSIKTDKIDDHTVIYFDMDGTLAKWNKYGDWTIPHYFRDLDANKNIVKFAKTLYDMGYDVRVLSKAKHSCIDDKYTWIKNNMPFIEKNKILFVPLDSDKSGFVSSIGENTILIDDYNPNLKDWKKRGGTAIKCITEVNNENPHFMSIYKSKDPKTNLQSISMVLSDIEHSEHDCERD